MASAKQIEANRRNAEKSTGPKSSTGKQSSSLNSLKHGLLSQNTLLPWENAADLASLKKEIMNGLHPVGPIENLLADRIASLTWRLYRVSKFESGLLSFFNYKRELDKANKNIDALTSLEAEPHPLLEKEKKDFDLSLNTLSSIEKMVDATNNLNSEISHSGQDFMAAAESITKLYRYENTLEKSLYKALHELQRIQAVRAGNNVPAPIAVDFNGEPENSGSDLI